MVTLRYADGSTNAGAAGDAGGSGGAAAAATTAAPGAASGAGGELAGFKPEAQQGNTASSVGYNDSAAAALALKDRCEARAVRAQPSGLPSRRVPCNASRVPCNASLIPMTYNATSRRTSNALPLPKRRLVEYDRESAKRTTVRRLHRWRCKRRRGSCPPAVRAALRGCLRERLPASPGSPLPCLCPCS